MTLDTTALPGTGKKFLLDWRGSFSSQLPLSYSGLKPNNPMNEKANVVLHLRSPGRDVQLIPLTDGQTVRVGRAPQNDIALADDSVSRQHALFSCSNFGVVVSDLGSTNGTFLNGDQLTSMRDLAHGDLVNLGHSSIRIEIPQAEGIYEHSETPPAARSSTTMLQPVAVSVMSCRLVRFGEMSASLDPDELMKALLQWNSGASQVIGQEGGQVDKVIESSIVALWVGAARSEQAMQALTAARKIFEFSKLFGSEGKWQHQTQIPWDVMVVLCSGHGLSGKPKNRREGEAQFTIVGDPVNEAFRLFEKMSGKPPGIILHSSTAMLLEGKLEQGTLTSASGESEAFRYA